MVTVHPVKSGSTDASVIVNQIDTKASILTIHLVVLTIVYFIFAKVTFIAYEKKKTNDKQAISFNKTGNSMAPFSQTQI